MCTLTMVEYAMQTSEMIAQIILKACQGDVEVYRLLNVCPGICFRPNVLAQWFWWRIAQTERKLVISIANAIDMKFKCWL